MNTFPPKQILVPTDFSEHAERAVAQAFALAETVSAKVHLLNAYDLYSYGMSAVMIHRLLHQAFSEHEQLLKLAAEPYRSSSALGEQLVKLGDAREVILETARELQVDLIIMGTAGKQGLKRMLLGSVAESVVRTSERPVMIVKLETSASAADRA